MQQNREAITSRFFISIENAHGDNDYANDEEDLRQKYVQTVINIGNQVNEALADCQAAREKHGYYHRQVEVLREAYMGTHELMDNGKANYLEVLTAQETLLNFQLNEAMNMYKAAQAVVTLYISLGGGTEALR